MRSSSGKEGPLLRWLIPGTIIVGASWFAACSSKESTNDPGGPSGPNEPMCMASEVICAERCVDTASNALNCGACGAACGSGQICQNSACVMGSCTAPTVMCNGACVDRQTDARNCGTCDAQCAVGASCQAGACVGGTGTGGTGGAGTGGASGSSTGGASGSSTGGASTGGTDATGGTAGDTGTGGTAGDTGTGGSGGSGMTGGSGGAGMTGGSGGKGGSGGGTTGPCRIWLATNGNDSNPGTEASPVATLLHAYDLTCPKPPDGTENGAECLGAAPRTICVKSGTYPMAERFEFKKTRMGTMSSRITLQGDPASTTRPIFNFTTQPRLTSCGANVDNMTGITVNASYVTVKNVVVQNANDTCVLVNGTQDIIEHVLVHDCADTGLQISSGGDFTGSGTNNTISNCDSYGNYDVLCAGENADGFGIKEGTGTGNVFTGCRSWDNTDDGFDFFAWTSPVRIENCWAFDQSRSHDGANNDGNGFKMGGDGVSAAHQLRDLYATGNTRGSNGEGFLRNSNPASMACAGTCASWGNTVNTSDGITGVGTTAVAGATVAKMSADAARNADGSLKAIGSL